MFLIITLQDVDGHGFVCRAIKTDHVNFSPPRTDQIQEHYWGEFKATPDEALSSLSSVIQRWRDNATETG